MLLCIVAHNNKKKNQIWSNYYIVQPNPNLCFLQEYCYSALYQKGYRRALSQRNWCSFTLKLKQTFLHTKQ